MKPAIVLSTHTMGLGVIRALGIMGVPIIAVFYDDGDMGYVSNYVKERIHAPHPEASEDQFIDLLMKSATRFHAGLLIPADDATLATVSRSKGVLERHYTVACTDWEITEQFLDKSRTYALADAAGVPAPRTLVPRSAEDAKQYGKTIEYPCLVKPCQSHLFYDRFLEKMIRVETLDHMLSVYHSATNAGLGVMLQEIIPGDDANGANYNSYSWNGEPLVEFTAQQVRNGPPEFGSPRVVVSKHIPEVLEPGRKMLQAMRFHGYSCTEFKKDARDGVYKLMEVNGRHNRSSLLSVRCGMNFPWLQYQHLVHGELPSASDFEAGVYWIALARDLGYSLKYRKQERYSLTEYLTPYLRPHAFATLDLKDPRPFIKRFTNLIRGSIE